MPDAFSTCRTQLIKTAIDWLLETVCNLIRPGPVCVITGHITLPSGTDGPFARLHELRHGDRIIVHAWGMRYIYEVTEQDLVQPDDPSIFRHEDRAWVTLLTCAVYDERTETYQMRRLVRAVLIQIEPLEIAALGG